jgi:hypothetical protein
MSGIIFVIVVELLVPEVVPPPLRSFTYDRFIRLKSRFEREDVVTYKGS